jgi:hypothetical protein
VAPEDAEAMAQAIVTLLTDDGLREILGKNAARDAQQRFSLDRQVDEYLFWYQHIRAANEPVTQASQVSFQSSVRVNSIHALPHS